MNKNEIDLNLPEGRAGSRIIVYSKIVFLPVLVLGLFAFGYFSGYWPSIDKTALMLMGVILLFALFFARHNARFGCYIFEQQQIEFKKDLKEFIIKTLLTIGKETKSNGDFDDFVRNYTRFVRNDSFANVASATFSILGVLGVFVCIALRLPNFAFSDAKEFEFEIAQLFISVGSAFYVAIYGLLLALWWIFFERFGQSRFRVVINRQKLATRSFFWSREEIEHRQLQESIDSFAKISQIFGYVSNQEFFKELDRVIENKFENFTNIMKNEEQAVKLSGEQLKQTMAGLSKAQREQKDMARVHSEIINVLYNFNQTLKEMQESFAQNYARLQTISDERIVRLERAIGSLCENVDRFEMKLEHFNANLLDNQRVVLDGFRSAMFDGMQAFRKTFDDEGTDAQESIDTIKDLRESIAQLDKEANDALANLQEKRAKE